MLEQMKDFLEKTDTKLISTIDDDKRETSVDEIIEDTYVVEDIGEYLDSELT
ncbi:hypothetical protein [Halarcobacter sp.]|uniref:hypothetical protein n=1 Tax=Halarcobacter sp. TaxID=2321133 RepID=UPI0029F546A3|nr:hypothetical protein [Halarcobacter sp.]